MLQVSDPQDLSFANHTMKTMLDKAYDTMQPDLVVFTGDNILGNHLRDARFGTYHTIKTDAGEKRRMIKAIDHIIAPLEKRDIPFVFIYGNHDDVNSITKEEQAEIFKSYPTCVMPEQADPNLDVDTCYLPLYSSDKAKEIFRLWLFDSAWHDKKEKRTYEYVKPEAVKWFKECCEANKRSTNGIGIPGLLFIHIPLPEQMNLLEPCPNGTGGIRIRLDESETAYRLNSKLAVGALGEPPCVLEKNTGLFDAVKSDGSVLAIVSGHDHTNCFDGTWNGVRFIQTACASFRCYGDRNRGVRLFELDEENPTLFKTTHFTYSDLCGDGFLSNLRYIMDADGMQKYKYPLLAATAIGLTGITTGIIKKFRK
ncbi:MAG: metallophosphoesterase [Clostridia bacterium]|nr:metallophosphoesterase [Clostridia bacterium]